MDIKEPPVVIFLDHTAKWSGGEIALLRTLEAMDRSRVTPVLVVAEDGPLVEKACELGIETHILPLSKNLREVRKDTLGGLAVFSRIGAAISLFTYARKVARFARKRGAFLLHCNSLKADIYGAVAGKLARIPILWHVRDHIDPSYLPPLAVTVFRALAKRWPDYIVTNSESTRERIFPEGSGKQRCAIVHDGLALWELNAPAPPEANAWKNQPPRVGLVGRFVAWKGQDVFLKAAALLTAQGIEARYVLIGAPLFGEQEYTDGLHRQAEALGDRVEFTGFQKDVPALLRTLDILVHASVLPEPFGQVVIEGMAEGLPVIATDGGGVQEIVTDGENGLLAPLGDADRLTEILGALLQDPKRASHLAQNGHRHVRAHFTAGQNARKIEQVYEEIKRTCGASAQ